MQTLIIVSIIFLCCSKTKLADEKIQNINEELSSHFLYSENCKCLFYSSNKDNLFGPYQIKFTKESFVKQKINLPIDQDFFVRAVSKDCKFLALVSDINGNQIYDVFIYDSQKRKLFNVTNSYKIDEGNPHFSPLKNRLAFLSSGRLTIYSIEDRKVIFTSSSHFKSFSWASDQHFIFLEDFSSNIWALNTENYKLKKLWTSPSKSYVPKMFSTFKNELLFISDHTGFSQIYILDTSNKKITRPLNVKNDIYSPQINSEGTLSFRMNVEGSILNYTMDITDSTIQNVGFNSGVSYQYYSSPEITINLFADMETPKTLMVRRGDAFFKNL